MSDIYNLEMNSITGESVSFSDYREQAMLVINLASQWGLTGQYTGLCALESDRDDLKVLGFPCNQFGAQEPGSDEEILKFAKNKYDCNFQLFSKVEVNGDGACDLYNILKSEKANPDGNPDIGWNFTKFLVGRDGKVLARFEPMVTPEEIADQLDGLLA
jgi:glutathione peroxidase